MTNKFMIVLHDVNNQEVELGPFGQVCFEVEVARRELVPVLKDVASSVKIAYNHGGFWFYDGRPFKQAFVRAQEPTDG